MATQPRLRVSPSGRKKWVEAVIINSKIFIRATEKQRLSVLSHPYIYRFMVNPTGHEVNGHKPIATVNDDEIQKLRFMLGQSDYPVEISETRYKAGNKVRIIRGSLKGLEGSVLNPDETHHQVIIHLNFLGSAKVTVPSSDLELIDTGNGVESR